LIWFLQWFALANGTAYFNCRYPVARKTPKNYTKKGDGEKIVKGICPPCSKQRKPHPPAGGAFKKRDNPPNSLVSFTLLGWPSISRENINSALCGIQFFNQKQNDVCLLLLLLNKSLLVHFTV
jgi:hypothetical protein